MNTDQKQCNINMEVEIAGVKLKNPVMEASGTFGSGEEYLSLIHISEPTRPY